VHNLTVAAKLPTGGVATDVVDTSQIAIGGT
jgi:hypothetical protein